MTRTTDDTTETDRRAADLDWNGRAGTVPSGRCRTTMAVLAGSEAPVDLLDLAATVAAREGTDTDEETLDRVALTLHHAHLPRLDDVGVVVYDPVAHRVVTCPPRTTTEVDP